MVYNGKKIVTLEDNVLYGGFGSLVTEYIGTLNKKTKLINLGFKDEFIPHGGVDILYKSYGLDVDGIIQSIMKLL
ncbi:1-deoxy-D-xylulose-5-phosphate synthase [Clostridium tetanomorphum]|nr:1-deoxy-D-xylulose-5-phosphate synthase [Clostridium tetanomorphum]